MHRIMKAVVLLLSLILHTLLAFHEPPFNYGDCQEKGASYTYGDKVICYYIDEASIPLGTHCGSFGYAWIPNSGANYIVRKLTEQSDSTIDYHIGYSINFTSQAEFVVTAWNGKTQNYSNVQNMSPTINNDCLIFREELWIPKNCDNLNLKAICSYTMTFSYGDCRSDGVSYFDGVNLFCYWIDEVKTDSLSVCNGIDYSLIPNFDAQRVVNWLIKLRNHTDTYYHIGYKESTAGPLHVITHHDVPQSWTFWKNQEPNSQDDSCIAIEAPYGYWINHSCSFPRPAVCSTMTKTVPCEQPLVTLGSSISSITGLLYNDIVTYTCNQGYEYAGSLVLRCQYNGHWDNYAPNCQAIECAAPDILANSTIDCPDYVFNSTCHYGCDYGYEITGGNQTRRCRHDGAWDGQAAVCTEITCQSPVVFENSTVSCPDGNTFGSVCTFKCNYGYELHNGELSIQCDINGLWNAPSPNCEAVDCHWPKEGIHSSPRCLNGTTFGQVCTYICHYGFQLINGDLEVECQANRSWSGIVPKCTDSITTISTSSDELSSTAVSLTTTEYQSTSTQSETTLDDLRSTAVSLTTTEYQSTSTQSETTLVDLHSTTVSPITSGYQSTYLPVPIPESCHCPCILTPNITVELSERIEELQKALTVDKQTLSATIRARNCADDPRPSSSYIGYTGVIIITVVFSVVVLFDLLNVYQAYCSAKSASNNMKV